MSTTKHTFIQLDAEGVSPVNQVKALAKQHGQKYTVATPNGFFASNNVHLLAEHLLVAPTMMQLLVDNGIRQRFLTQRAGPENTTADKHSHPRVVRVVNLSRLEVPPVNVLTILGGK
ncbi:hypothetical protein AB4304_13975 [Vibrio breoganii]